MMIPWSPCHICPTATRLGGGKQPRVRKRPRLDCKSLGTLILAMAILPITALAEVSNGDFELRYTPASGNLTLLFTGVGTSGTGPVSLKSLSVLTRGDGSIGAPMPSGIPNVTASTGGLNGAVATLPTAAFQTFNNEEGLNGIYSEIFNAGTTSWRTFDKASPGVSDVLNLGNVAAVGWNQPIIDTVFITDNETYSSLNPGFFGYITDSTPLVGRVVAVPEPTVPVAVIGITAAIVASQFRRA